MGTWSVPKSFHLLSLLALAGLTPYTANKPELEYDMVAAAGLNLRVALDVKFDTQLKLNTAS